MAEARARILRRDELDRRALPETPEAWLAELGQRCDSLWLRVPGRDRSRTRAVATLIHGNEPSGLRAVHAWLRTGAVPATDVVFWIAALRTALGPPLFARRALPGGRDLNRCFRPPFTGSAEDELAGEALALLRETRPELLLDLHNNTGHSPAYAVGYREAAVEVAVSSLFGDFFVHSGIALGALTEVTVDDFPSVTIECGRAGDPEADAIARRGLARALELDHLRAHALEERVRVLRDPLRVRIRDGVKLHIGEAPGAGADLTVAADVDRHSFELLPAGTRIGWLRPGADWPIELRTTAGNDLARDWFRVRDGRLEAARPLIPLMVTTDVAIASSDCLFYVVAG